MLDDVTAVEHAHEPHARGSDRGLDGPAVVSFRDTAVARGGRTIWSGASFDIPEGAFTAIIGPNGSGKSTLVSMLLGQIKPSAGQLDVFGESPKRGNAAIGLVPQNHALDNAASVQCRDVVALGLLGTKWGMGLRSKKATAAIDEALAAVDATEFAHRRFGEVSGGQQQRISIAQALIMKPRLLVLDEPLAGLDLQGQVDIIELVHHINHDRGVTALFVTHDLNPLLAHIDSVLYLLDGRPQFGSADDVVDADLLTRLYGTPVQVARTADGCIYTRTE